MWQSSVGSIVELASHKPMNQPLKAFGAACQAWQDTRQ